MHHDGAGRQPLAAFDDALDRKPTGTLPADAHGQRLPAIVAAVGKHALENDRDLVLAGQHAARRRQIGAFDHEHALERDNGARKGGGRPGDEAEHGERQGQEAQAHRHVVWQGKARVPTRARSRRDDPSHSPAALWPNDGGRAVSAANLSRKQALRKSTATTRKDALPARAAVPISVLQATSDQGLHRMTLRLLGHVELPPNKSKGGFDHADVHHPTDRLYVAHTCNDAVDVIDCAQDRYLESIAGLTGVAGALVSEARGLVFTSNRGENTISVFAPGAERDAGKIAVGIKPNGLAFDPARGILIAANVGDPEIADSYTLSVVDVT